MCVLGWAALWSCWFQEKKMTSSFGWCHRLLSTVYAKNTLSPPELNNKNHLITSNCWNKGMCLKPIHTENVYLQLQLKSNISPELLIKANRPNAYRSDCVPLQVYSSMEHLSQLEQKATSSVSRREHKGPREDKVTKRESLGSFSMRDKSWRTGSPEMWVVGSIE